MLSAAEGSARRGEVRATGQMAPPADGEGDSDDDGDGAAGLANGAWRKHCQLSSTGVLLPATAVH